MTDYLPHRFNPLIAKVYSLPAALVFQYIAYRCAKEKAKFLPLTLDELASHYPYLCRTSVRDALQLLVFPTDNPALISRKIVKGVRHYGVIPTDSASVLQSFNANVAAEHGIVAAIILHSVGYWVKQNWTNKADQLMAEMDPHDYDGDYDAMSEDSMLMTVRGASHTTTIEDWTARHDYISERTARRGFLCLQHAGLLKKQRGKRHKTIYTLSTDLLAEYADKLLINRTFKNRAANSELRPANSELRPANSERKQGLTDSTASVCASFDEAYVDEPVLIKHDDAFAAPSLADARSVARSASHVLALRAALNQPGYPRKPRKRPCKKRAYICRPKPDDPDFDLYVDDLSPVEREKYLDQFRGKNGS